MVAVLLSAANMDGQMFMDRTGFSAVGVASRGQSLLFTDAVASFAQTTRRLVVAGNFYRDRRRVGYGGWKGVVQTTKVIKRHNQRRQSS